MRSGRPNMLKAYTQKGFTKNPIGKCDPVLYRLWHPKLAVPYTKKYFFFGFFVKFHTFKRRPPLPPSVNILNGISDSYSVGFTKSVPLAFIYQKFLVYKGKKGKFYPPCLYMSEISGI